MVDRIQAAAAAAMYGAWPPGSLGAVGPMLSMAAAAQAAAGFKGFPAGSPFGAMDSPQRLAALTGSPYTPGGVLPHPGSTPGVVLPPSAVQPLPSALPQGGIPHPYHPAIQPFGLPPSASTPTKTEISPRSDTSSKSPATSPAHTTAQTGEKTHSSFSMDRILGAKTLSSPSREADLPGRKSSISPASQPRSPGVDNSPDASPTTVNCPVPLRPSASHPLNLHRHQLSPVEAQTERIRAGSNPMDRGSVPMEIAHNRLSVMDPARVGGIAPAGGPTSAAAEAALYAQAAARYTALRDSHLHNPLNRTLHRTTAGTESR